MRTLIGACLLASALIGPAFAQNTAAQGTAKKGSDADEAFMTGLRKVGVMSGQAWACSARRISQKSARQS